MLVVTTERVLWRYDNASRFTNQSEVDFGSALVIVYYFSATEMELMILFRFFFYISCQSLESFTHI
jgi:hypothetical protein